MNTYQTECERLYLENKLMIAALETIRDNDVEDCNEHAGEVLELIKNENPQ